MKQRRWAETSAGHRRLRYCTVSGRLLAEPCRRSRDRGGLRDCTLCCDIPARGHRRSSIFPGMSTIFEMEQPRRVSQPVRAHATLYRVGSGRGRGLVDCTTNRPDPSFQSESRIKLHQRHSYRQSVGHAYGPALTDPSRATAGKYRMLSQSIICAAPTHSEAIMC